MYGSICSVIILNDHCCWVGVAPQHSYTTTSVLIRFTTSHHCGKNQDLTNFQHIHLLKPKPLQSIFANHFSSSIWRFFRHHFSAWQADKTSWQSGQIFVKWTWKQTSPDISIFWGQTRRIYRPKLGPFSEGFLQTCFKMRPPEVFRALPW